MTNEINIYEGASSYLGLPSESIYGEYSVKDTYSPNVSDFSVSVDPRTANQIAAVSAKINTGVRSIEVSGLSTQILDSIPRQHFKEISRLKKLTGVEFTFHGPLVEPTGVSAGQNWSELNRRNAERQLFSAVERAKDLDAEGNVVVTFHSSHELPEPEVKYFDEKEKKEKVESILVIDEKSGEIKKMALRPSSWEKKSYDSIEEIKDFLKKINEDRWVSSLDTINFHAYRGASIIEEARSIAQKSLGDLKIKDKEDFDIISFYSKLQGEEGKRFIDSLPERERRVLNEIINPLTHAEIELRNAYHFLQEQYDEAYRNADEKKRRELEAFRDECKRKFVDSNGIKNLNEFLDQVNKGLNLIRGIVPETYKPFKEFALEKATTTFSNVAFESYKKFGEKTPIISIENPPVGIGLSRPEDIKIIVEETRKKFAEKLIEEKKMSEEEAKKVAEKIIGATWDVGHINLLRKYGYSEKDIIEGTKRVAPFVKHVHLSDNFGAEHTELPMGMGNVPIKPMLEAIEKYNKKVKKVIEAGNWYEPFKTTPLRETLAAFGSPIYSMKMSPYWNQFSNMFGGYFSGYGPTLPERHFSMYGSGFYNLPVELGGKTSGESRVSGAPIN